ncbi:MAG: hypothetical protein PF689_04325 [Deltaproteobacteria bacterium]|jgi:hypothetical protein|nr:hypothetical protein [Deltaproteobacteria bacterium]
MSALLTALVIGFSFGNLWVCAILVFSLQNAGRLTCLGYLAGRFLAIIILSVVVSIFGHYFHLDRSSLNIASGVLLLLFSSYLAATRVFSWTPPWRKKTDNSGLEQGSCEGDCSDCPAHHHPEYVSACDDCHEHGLCSAEDYELEPISRDARKAWGRETERTLGNNWWPGFTLGFLRGGAMCTKLVVLIPILLNSTILRTLAIATVFAFSSSIYPLLGFIAGKYALKLVKFKRHLFIASCIFMFGLGLKYILAGIDFWH